MPLAPFFRRRQLKLAVAVLLVGLVVSALVALALIYLSRMGSAAWPMT